MFRDVRSAGGHWRIAVWPSREARKYTPQCFLKLGDNHVYKIGNKTWITIFVMCNFGCSSTGIIQLDEKRDRQEVKETETYFWNCLAHTCCYLWACLAAVEVLGTGMTCIADGASACKFKKWFIIQVCECMVSGLKHWGGDVSFYVIISLFLNPKF